MSVQLSWTGGAVQEPVLLRGDLCVLPVVLHGLDLESEHCMFENKSGTVTLAPVGGAQCSVNGVLVTEPAPLNQGEEPTSAPHNGLHVLETSRRPTCRRRHLAGQNQHVPLQPSQGSGETAGETEGGCGSFCCCPRRLPLTLCVLLRAGSYPPSACP